MAVLVTFGTNDGVNLNDDHLGMARYFPVYQLYDDKAIFVETRQNSGFKGDESMKHGDPAKAKSTSSVLEGIDIVVGKKFGPNLPRLLHKFVCVVVRTNTIDKAIQCIQRDMPTIENEMNKKCDRKHIVLKP